MLTEQTPFVIVLASGFRVAIGAEAPECELQITDGTARVLHAALGAALGLPKPEKVGPR